MTTPHTSPTPPPRISPTGIVEYAPDYQGSARVYPWHLKLIAVVVLALFATVTIATTSASLGAWCLTSASAPPAGTMAR